MCRAEKCNLRHRIPSRESLVICICLFKDQRPHYLTLAVDVHKYVQVLNTHTVIRSLDIAPVYVHDIAFFSKAVALPNTSIQSCTYGWPVN